MFHHGLLATSELIPMVNVPCPVSHDDWRRHVSSSRRWSGVNGRDAAAMVSATTGSSWDTGTSAYSAFLIVAASAFWSTDAAVIKSPDTVEPELLCGAVVFEQAASSTTAAQAATN